jgi:hypothetical protein
MHSNCIRSGDVYSKFCIRTKRLGKSKVCAKWIPRMLNEDQYAINVLLATADFSDQGGREKHFFLAFWKWMSCGCTHIMHDWSVKVLNAIPWCCCGRRL